MMGYRSTTVIARSILIAAGLAGLCVAAAQAQPAAAGHDQCFLVSNIDGFHASDDRTVYVRVGISDIYKLELMTECTGLTFREDIGLDHRGSGPWICSPLDAEVVYRDAGVPERCPVSAMHRLTPAERDALPKRDRP
jgi:uncharacterized membrane protein YuzA (DUF378 family)